MYTAFFNLLCNPFQLTPDPDFLFLSREHKKALTFLRYGMSSNTGFILVTGEVGTGKTTLIRQILKELQDDIKVARVNNTLVNSEQLITMINDDFGIETKGRGKTEMLRDLSDFIVSRYAQGFRTALIIDEAQNLSTELMEEIRLLSNLETDKDKLLQIILAGQPELKRHLAVPELRQFRQRINISCHINPLNRDEMEEYIMHRLEVAGNRDAVKFLDGALDELHAATHGIPRLINIFCDFLLLTAYNEERKEISAEHVRDVSEDIDAEDRYWKDTEPEQDKADTAHILQSILSRLDRLEAAVNNNQAGSKSDIEEIRNKMNNLEGIIKSTIQGKG
jgi:general secretion pathway protein A